MIHAILLAAQFRLVVAEGQDVSRRVDFGDNLHKIPGGLHLEVTELVLGVMSVAGRQTGIGVTLQTEGGVGLVPVILEILLEAIVIQVDLEDIHLVIRHGLGKILQVGHRDELAAAVHHEAAHGIVRPVRYLSLGQGARLALLAHLEQRAGGPINAHGFRCRHHYLLAYLDGVAFLAQFFVFFQRQAELPLRASCRTSRHSPRQNSAQRAAMFHRHTQCESEG